MSDCKDVYLAIGTHASYCWKTVHCRFCKLGSYNVTISHAFLSISEAILIDGASDLKHRDGYHGSDQGDTDQKRQGFEEGLHWPNKNCYCGINAEPAHYGHASAQWRRIKPKRCRRNHTSQPLNSRQEWYLPPAVIVHAMQFFLWTHSSSPDLARLQNTGRSRLPDPDFSTGSWQNKGNLESGSILSTGNALGFS